MNVNRPCILLSAFISLLLSSPISTLAQTSSVRPRVTQTVDMQNLSRSGETSIPWRRPQFDQGAAPDDLPMQRMLLVLQRGADQEASFVSYWINSRISLRRSSING